MEWNEIQVVYCTPISASDEVDGSGVGQGLSYRGVNEMDD